MERKFKYSQFASENHRLYAIEKDGTQYVGNGLSRHKAHFRFKNGDQMKVVFNYPKVKFVKEEICE